MRNVLLFLLAPGCLLAQNPDETPRSEGSYRINAAWHYGFVIAHRSSIAVLQQDHTKSLELGLFRQTSDAKSWPGSFAYPEIGLRYIYTDLGNAAELGKVHALAFVLEFGRFKTEDVAFSLGLGFGLGYITRTFDQATNHKNISIGSGMNGTFSLGATYRFRVFRQAFVTAALNFNHYSNAAVKMPNLGFNIPSASIGIRQYLGRQLDLPTPNPAPYEKGFRHFIGVSGAIKEIYPVNGPTYYVAAISGGSLWRFTRNSALGPGFDVHYDNSLLYKLASDAEPDPPESQGVRVGLNLSYELIFDRCSFTLQAGRYVRSQLKDEGMTYQRIGMRYDLWRQVFVHTGLKVHFGKADFVDLGLGIRF